MYRVIYNHSEIFHEKITLCETLKGVVRSITGVLYHTPKALYLTNITIEEQAIENNTIVWKKVDPLTIIPLISNKRKQDNFKEVM